MVSKRKKIAFKESIYIILRSTYENFIRKVIENGDVFYKPILHNSVFRYYGANFRAKSTPSGTLALAKFILPSLLCNLLIFNILSAFYLVISKKSSTFAMS